MPPPKPQPPAPALKPISSIKLKDIKNLDVKELQNLDYLGFLKDMQKRPDTAIVILLPILVLWWSFADFNNTAANRKKLTADITLAKEKITIMQEYESAQSEYKKFIDSLPQRVTETEFINLITDFAAKNDVQIESFSPTKNQNDPTFDMIVINMTANAPSYDRTWDFIRAIESTGLNVRINNWSASMGQKQGAGRRSRGGASDDGIGINFRLEVAVINFKT